MKRITSTVGFAILAVFAVGGCGDDGNNGNNNPAPPALSSNQIDRMGRAGVNTAVTNPFFRETVEEEQAMHEEVLDEYNAAADSTRWASMFSDELAANLAILDSLDRVCGNAAQQTGPAEPGRYDPIAAIVADDALYVNTASGTCQQYLAVEANVAGDCGGRTPLEDTIDTTYSLFATGGLTGVTDGIDRDEDGTASLTAFPFLDTPNG